MENNFHNPLQGSDDKESSEYADKKEVVEHERHEQQKTNRAVIAGLAVALIAAAFLCILFFVILKEEKENDPNYILWCIGNCNQDVVTVTQPGAILIGGGADPDEAFAWQIRNTNGGDYLILSAADYGDEYNNYIYNMSIALGVPVNSVTTIQFYNEKASYDTNVLNTIRNSEGIFFEGGDQSRYMNWWVGTEVQTILESKVATVTLGGTSAGLAILGNWVYSAQYDSIYSYGALQNPYDYRITIEGALLHIPYLDTVITDTHFFERNRMGRMLTFLARILQDSSSADVSVARALGVDEPCGLILNVTNGDVKAVGSGNAYLCTSSQDPTLCAANTPLTFRDVACVRISCDTKETFSFSSWTGQGVSYVNDIEAGVFVNNAYGF